MTHDDPQAIFVWFCLAMIGIAGAVVSRHWWVGGIVGAVLFLAGLVLVGVPQRRPRRLPAPERAAVSAPEQVPVPAAEPIPVLTGRVVKALPAGSDH